MSLGTYPQSHPGRLGHPLHTKHSRAGWLTPLRAREQSHLSFHQSLNPHLVHP
ncbi:hypothetical protein HanIR_Chr07g0312951 [Helianthus annuus]|nr:hypothetical protein HanIR_Chr07g0312951 [Helianthus annuus]